MTRPRPDAPLQTGWIPVADEPGAKGAEPVAAAAPPDHAEPPVPLEAEPPPDKQPIVTYDGLAFVEQSGNPVVDVTKGAMTFSDPGTGLVFASVGERGRAHAANYSLGFQARTESGAWQLAVDANPHARSEAERAGTVVAYRVGESPGLRVTRHGKKLVSTGAFPVDLNWHEVKALLSASTLALYVDRNQVLVLQRSRPTSWIGLGGTGEFKEIELKAK
jgi:hypothetical protein